MTPIPIDTLARRLSDDLALLNRRLQRLARQQDQELPPTQTALIRQLRQSPMTIGELARSESLSTATVSRCVDRLEERNLVWRARDKNDRRIVYVVARREAIHLVQDQPEWVLPELSACSVEQLQRWCDSVAELNRLLEDSV